MNKFILTSLLVLFSHSLFAFNKLDYSINITKDKDVLLNNNISLKKNNNTTIFKTNIENALYVQKIGILNQNNMSIQTQESKSNLSKKETKLNISYNMENDNIKTKIVIEEISNSFEEDNGAIASPENILGSASKLSPNNVKKDIMVYEFLSLKKSNTTFNWNGLVFNIDIK